MMSQRNGIMIPILLFMLLSNGKPSLSNPPDVTSSNSKDLTRYTCINQADKKRDQPIKPVWIHSSNDAQNESRLKLIYLELSYPRKVDE